MLESGDNLIGRTLGEFVIREKLGEGGFGVVYRAEQPALARPAVIKVLRQKHHSNSEVIERFTREARLASRLEHPYTASIYAFGAEEDGLLWIAMELVRGTPLDRLIEAQGPLAPERFAPLLDKICEVVHTAHESGIVHRDLKPSNVMVIVRAGRMLPKLLDFGIAKSFTGDAAERALVSELPVTAESLDKATLKIRPPGEAEPALAKTTLSGKGKSTAQPQKLEALSHIETVIISAELPTKPSEELHTVGIIGSPPYMAPEQWQNAAAVSARTDIYSLGVLCYEVLTGRFPFRGSMSQIAAGHLTAPPPPLGAHLPAALDKVMARAMAKRADERYATAIELAADFRAACGIVERMNLPQLDDALRERVITHAPYPLALATANIGSSQNAHQAREQVLQVFRIAARYLGLLALACRARMGRRGGTDSAVVYEALRKLRQQSLSGEEWLTLAQELCRPFAGVRDAHPIPEMVAFFFAAEGEQPGRAMKLFEPLLELRQSSVQLAGTEAQVRQWLVTYLPRLAELLRALDFLADYALVVPDQEFVVKWAGTVHTRMPNCTEAAAGRPIITDGDGRPILQLWPLMQVVEPAPGTPAQLFLLEGRSRKGAKLVALPSGFEYHDDSVWEWFGRNLLEETDQNDHSLSVDKTPYLGLASFTPADGEIFFGREREAGAVLNRLRTHALLAVVGPSGAGKSSFVQAAIVTGLPLGWQAVTVRPGHAPLAALLARLNRDGIETAELAHRLKGDRDALGATLRAHLEKRKEIAGLLLVIDQFEELFTLCLDEEERALYTMALARAARSVDDPVRIIITLRDDFLVRARESAELGDRITQGLELLTTPKQADLLRILVMPAERAGYRFEDDDLPAEIVNAVVGRPGSLPLLAFTAARLWEMRDRQFRQLRRKTYEGMGGVGGALARHAEEVMSRMPQDEQALVREAFRRLVTGEGTRAVVNRLELVEVLGGGAKAETVIERLVGARLLTASEGEGGVDNIEVVHEVLLSAWPRLVKWRQEDAEGARLRDQLQAAARQWEERGRPRGMLWRDDALAEYQLWRSRYAGKLTESEHAFGAASLAEAARSKRVRQLLVVAAILVLALGSAVLFWQSEKTRRQLLETLELYEEQGRQELLKGEPQRAAIYLSEAYQKGADTLPLRFMLAQAMWSVENRPPLALAAHNKNLTVATVSGDGRLLLTAAGDGSAKVWQSADGKELCALSGHSAAITAAAFSADSKRVVTAGMDATAIVWDALSGERKATLSGHREGLLSAVFSADGSAVITAGYDGTAKIWESASGALKATLSGHGGAVYTAQFNGAAEMIVTASNDKTARLWAADGTLLATLSGHKGAVLAAQFSPDGERVVTAGIDGAALVWQTDGTLLATLAGHRDAIVSAHFSTDGARIVTASADRTARVWQARDGKLLVVLAGHKSNLYYAEFSSDNRFIATASYDQSARVWEADTGKFLSALQEHKEAVRAARFSPDVKAIMTASSDGMVKIWDIRPETRTAAEIAAIVGSRVPYKLEQGLLLPINDNRAALAEYTAARAASTNDAGGPKSYIFETATLDAEGNMIARRSGSARGYVEDLHGTLLEMVEIPGGAFNMGTPANEVGRGSEEELHKVTVPGFYLGRYEITVAQWRVVAGLPKVNRDIESNPANAEDGNLAVSWVSWEDAQEFCARLARLTGRKYRLPSEAEWEYACRAGTTTPYHFGPTLSPEVSNYDGRNPYGKGKPGILRGKVLPVGSLGFANAFGLYDMHGNVWEWCEDRHHESFENAPRDGSAWTAGVKEDRITRGGSFPLSAVVCRSATRGAIGFNSRARDTGLRVACSK